MVLASRRRSGSTSCQSAGMFWPPTSQRKSQRKRTARKTGAGLGSTAKTAATRPQALHHSGHQQAQMADLEEQAIDGLQPAAQQKDQGAHRVEGVGAQEGHQGPGAGPGQAVAEAHPAGGQGMAHEDGVQVRVGLGATRQAELFPVHPVVHHVVQGVDRGIAGKDGEQPQGDDSQRREMPQPEQGRQGRGGQVQQAVGGAGQGQEELEPGEPQVQGLRGISALIKIDRAWLRRFEQISSYAGEGAGATFT